MALLGSFEIILAFICFSLGCWFSSHVEHVRNWPVVGMLPVLLANIHRFHDWCLDLVERSGSTFHFKGPWFASMDIVATVDPANVKHVMSTNSSNYPKGSEYREIFDIFGEGLFNSDFDHWKNQRRVAVALVNHDRFHSFVFKTIGIKVKKGLIPVLEHASETGQITDLQDLARRFTLDTTTAILTGYDPESLSVGLPENEVETAMTYLEEAIFYRHVKPKMFWKLQRWLGLGVEKKMKIAWEIMDRVPAQYVAKKRQQLIEKDMEEENSDLLASYITNISKEGLTEGWKSEDKFLRDTIFNFLAAGRENSLGWFFWILLKNPHVEAKIREELNSLLPADEVHQGLQIFNLEKLNKLLYLHAALCESLRLYPPVMYEPKQPLQPDILPSGHHVDPKMKVIVLTHIMGKTKSIWGEDCLDFKPERWISKEDGRLIQYSPYKFIAFNAGARTCLGKDIAFYQMKSIVAAVLYNYNVQLVEGHPVIPSSTSLLLHIKHGLMVRISRRI